MLKLPPQLLLIYWLSMFQTTQFPSRFREAANSTLSEGSPTSYPAAKEHFAYSSVLIKKGPGEVTATRPNMYQICGGPAPSIHLRSHTFSAKTTSTLLTLKQVTFCPNPLLL